MEKKILSLLVLFLIFSSFCFTDESIFTPTTIEACYEYIDKNLTEQQKNSFKLSEKFPQELSWSIYKMNLVLNEDFKKTLNPIYYGKVHKEDYVSLIMESYWYYLKGIEFDFNTEFELGARYLESADEPQKKPEGVNLKETGSAWDYKYQYKGREVTESIHVYLAVESKQYYMYSYHFGWFLLSEEEYQDFSTNRSKRKYYVETKEKFFVE